MPDQLVYAMEVFLNGLMAGVLYALVALGFVLIYKASGIFNYAQGVMAPIRSYDARRRDGRSGTLFSFN